MLTVGTRVRVAIGEESSRYYAEGLADAMNGHAGTVVRVAGDDVFYLVRFDQPVVRPERADLPIMFFPDSDLVDLAELRRFDAEQRKEPGR